MPKPEQVLNIEPQNVLRFRGPFDTINVSCIKLTNPSDKKVLFKIKTTAPKKYCVRPNSGALEPTTAMEIAVCAQPFPIDPEEKIIHKFTIQTCFAPEGDVNLEQLWREIGPEQLMDLKLICVFEPPDENKLQEETTKNCRRIAVKEGTLARPKEAKTPKKGSNLLLKLLYIGLVVYLHV